MSIIKKETIPQKATVIKKYIKTVPIENELCRAIGIFKEKIKIMEIVIKIKHEIFPFI